MRIALCHEWLTVYGGSDQVAAAIAETFDIKDVFTFAQDPALAAELFPNSEVRTVHPVGNSDFARKHWGWLLPLMPYAWRRLDLSDYDAVITSAHSCVNAVRVRAGVPLISYCHTPIRYGWEWRDELRRFPRAVRPVWPLAARALRASDRRWAERVTDFVANSRNVADRIARYYGRGAAVVHPPIDTDYWTPDPSVEREDFLLYAGRLVAYKRPDTAVRAATEAGMRLVVAGSGPEAKRLHGIAGSGIEFVNSPSRDELRDLYRRTRALIFPGVEDFGMTLVEAQACGAPVLARAAGGALEIVRDGTTGILYSDETHNGLIEAMRSVERSSFDQDEVRTNAMRFGKDHFVAGMQNLLRAVTTRAPTSHPS